jgi:hypothetical protein
VSRVVFPLTGLPFAILRPAAFYGLLRYLGARQFTRDLSHEIGRRPGFYEARE